MHTARLVNLHLSGWWADVDRAAEAASHASRRPNPEIFTRSSVNKWLEKVNGSIADSENSADYDETSIVTQILTHVYTTCEHIDQHFLRPTDWMQADQYAACITAVTINI